MAWYTYMMLCADNTLYTGITNDLDKRILSHNNGTGSKYTAPRLPVKLVWHETHTDRSSASKREAEIKKLTRGEKNKLLSSRAPREI